MSEPLDRADHAAVLTSTVRFRGGVIDARTDRIRLDDGAVVERDVVVTRGAVGVIAMDEDERVLLVQQYRHPVSARLWEPPAGLLDQPGEPASTAAARELFEEAGYRARDWRVLVDAYASPGTSDEAYRVYLARDLTPAAERHVGTAEEKDMPQLWVELSDAVDRVLTGRLHNPMAVMGILALHVARQRGLDTLRPSDAHWPARPDHPG
ncbi:MAG: NUDIX domain-containing protein [Mycobacteriales bacterium]|nr:NUDIX hydrolase [Frankia sp.]